VARFGALRIGPPLAYVEAGAFRELAGVKGGGRLLFRVGEPGLGEHCTSFGTIISTFSLGTHWDDLDCASRSVDLEVLIDQ
jgi:hypothetical protein